MDDIELELCPFCGGEAHFGNEGGNWITCSRCWIETPYFDTAEEAAEAWNKRAKNGYWIAQDNTLTRFRCSVCGSENHSIGWKFCSACGSYMRKMEESDG